MGIFMKYDQQKLYLKKFNNLNSLKSNKTFFGNFIILNNETAKFLSF